MHYGDWELSLFASGSRKPIKEFRTRYFVPPDREPSILQASALFNPTSYDLPTALYTPNHSDPPNASLQSALRHVPVLSTFVPSLPEDTSFKISVNSWERPRPTRALGGMMQPGDSVMHEVRIFIDGTCVSTKLFNQEAHWPQVIGSSDRDTLRFPPFHEELVRQFHWDREMYGRIRVVIAEGFSRPRSPAFERVRDIIMFSFQHAPLIILELCGIAWPNPGMWLQGPPLNGKTYTKEDDPQSHSPNRQETRPAGTNVGTYQTTLHYRIPSLPSIADDVSMPDVASSRASRASSRAISTSMSIVKENSATAAADGEQ